MLISACSIVPESIRTADDAVLVSFVDAKNSSHVIQDKMARWGGVIAKVENKKEFTVLEVVNVELNSAAKPKSINESAGRFRLYYKGLLDPMIYQKGKDVTAVGMIGTSEDGKIGELEYQFPVLNVTGIYLWKEVQRINVRVKSDPFMDPYFNPYRGHMYPYSHSKTIIIKKPAKKSK